MKHLIIIGNGVTGVTTARHVRKNSNMQITIISDESDYFFSRTALMYIYMGHMSYENTKPYEDWFWKKNNINLIRGYVFQIDTQNKQLNLKDGRKINYDILVIATGSKSNKFGWPGQDLPGVQGLYFLQDLTLLEKNTKNIKHAVLVGGGLIGVELAEMLTSRKIPTTFLIREDYCWDIVLPKEEAKMVSDHIAEHGVDVRLSTELKEILKGEDGRVSGVITNKDEEIPCQVVGLTVGVHPNIKVVKESNIKTNYGVLVNGYLETNVDDVYAAGDCAEIKPGDNEQIRVEQLWYTGKMQAMALAKTICGKRTKYERGVWFNSAKFFDIEFQTYGFVSNRRREGEKSFFWQDDHEKKCIRIVYDEKSESVIGFNLLGIRFRQKVCEQWILEQKNLAYVLSHLREANFDPELFKRFEPDIIDFFNKENPGKHIQLKTKRGLVKKSA